MITLVIGGARSGKSSFAEMIAWKRGREEVVYLATARVDGSEMADRVRKHQNSRPAAWETIEEPLSIHAPLQKIKKGSVVLLDCITVFISNHLLQGENIDDTDKEIEGFNADDKEKEIMKELDATLKVIKERDLDLIIVSNEVGQGVVPEYRLGRVYRDISGRVNQFLARKADEVYITIAGLPVEIKEIGLKNIAKFS